MSGKRFKVLVTNSALLIPRSAIEILQEKCELVICESVPPSREEILRKAKGVDGIMWLTHLQLDKEALDAAGPNLKSASTISAGLDHVDISELKKRGVLLGHTPNILNEAVADLAIGLMLSAARRFHEGRLAIETSQWNPSYSLKWMLGRDIRGSTIGFVGFGNIAQAVADRLQGFKVGRILYNTRNRSPKESEYSAQHVSFTELLKNSDIIFIICPLTDATRGLFNATAFNLMKPTSILVNVARGPVVDQKALYDALKENKIFAAGLDVMVPEPLPSTDPLLSLPNCVLVPHLGSATEQTRSDMAAIAAKNVLNGLLGEPMISPAY